MTSSSRPILPTPDALVTGGQFNVGTYKEPLRTVNPLDAAIGSRPRWWKNLRLKEWQHFALVNDDYYLSLALFNAKTIGLAQVCVYERRYGSIKFYERKTLPWKIELPTALWNDRAAYRGKGFSIEIENGLERGRHDISFELAAQRDLPALSGRFTLLEDLTSSEPLVVCLPLKPKRAMYTHKYVCPVKGEMTLGDETVSFAPAASYGLIDIHKGYYPFVMKWHWATGGGYNETGRLCGFNLTDNQVKDQEAYNENCLWIDGRLFPLPPVKFKFVHKDVIKPWRITDADGLVDLTFTPEVVRTIDIKALILHSRYRGPFGSFSGRLQTADGEELNLDRYFGMCEDFYLRT